MKKISCDKDFKRIIFDCKKMGYTIMIRDISYVYLCRMFDDCKVVYKLLYGINASDDEAERYANRPQTKILIDYINSNYPIEEKQIEKKPEIFKKKKIDNDEDSITFDENRKGMEADIRAIEKLIKDGGNSLDTKELSSLIKIKADLRVKLNDKFGAGEKNEEQYIYIDSKYNEICPYCNREIRVPTEQELIEKYDLIKKV